LVTATNTANAAVPGTVQNDDTTTEIFKIFYRTPADVTTALQSVVNDITVTQDSANNQLIVTGTKSQLNQVSDVLDKIDIEKNQVMIEAYILSATDGFTKSFDANLQAAYAQKTGRDGPITNIIAGSNPTNETAITAATIGGDPVSTIATSGAVILGRIGMTQLKAIINASISDTNSETISNPKLFAMDGEEASLVQGLTLIKELAGSGAQAGDIKQIPQNLNLTVTPRVIGNGDKIEVDFSLANDSPGESVGDNTTTNNENINSKILINAGEVAILGGVYKNNKTDNITFVPFFRNIPILGSFFKTKTKSDTKSQLLIFLTATVV
jgi:type IV pilus assembly protein PilQ